jgi:hypothetical protein
MALVTSASCALSVGGCRRAWWGREAYFARGRTLNEGREGWCSGHVCEGFGVSIERRTGPRRYESGELGDCLGGCGAGYRASLAIEGPTPATGISFT